MLKKQRVNAEGDEQHQKNGDPRTQKNEREPREGREREKMERGVCTEALAVVRDKGRRRKLQRLGAEVRGKKRPD